jgi:hypothetical protein
MPLPRKITPLNKRAERHVTIWNDASQTGQREY